ncbi:MAG: hypothetical protein OIN88_05985 [Candidatus Methanoperedens sp.]|nr:hypothetical protein [Candidatus Methanoperedens sp.]HLB71776.1 hypothetical protein [Candidatus Methanoperedens sp.]
MRVSRPNYVRIDALSKISGLILLAVSIENASKGNYLIALALFGLGGLISVVPVFIEVKT